MCGVTLFEDRTVYGVAYRRVGMVRSDEVAEVQWAAVPEVPEVPSPTFFSSKVSSAMIAQAGTSA